MRDTGFPKSDAEADFLRERRRQVTSGLTSALLGRGADKTVLSFEEVVTSLGRIGEQPLGIREIPLNRVLGSVDKVRDFDPEVRPRSGRSRERWERLDEAVRRGQAIPPIDVYQVGDLYFVRDGHHRVSVMRALGMTTIEADVTRVFTMLDPAGVAKRADLVSKSLRRVMLNRTPLPREDRGNVRVSDPEDYPRLAEMIEAWAARTMFTEGTFMDRRTAAERWYHEEFGPAVELIDEAGLRTSDETAADAYLRVAGDRYRAYLEHVWSKEMLVALKGKKGYKRLVADDVRGMLSSDVTEVLRGRARREG